MDVTATIFKRMDCFIEMEVPEKHIARFKREYSEAAGETPIGKDGYLPCHLAGEKAVLYFNGTDRDVAELLMLGYGADDGVKNPIKRGTWKSEYRYRMYSNHLFWQLIRNGFRLGKHSPAPAQTDLSTQKPASTPIVYAKTA